MNKLTFEQLEKETYEIIISIGTDDTHTKKLSMIVTPLGVFEYVVSTKNGVVHHGKSLTYAINIFNLLNPL